MRVIIIEPDQYHVEDKVFTPDYENGETPSQCYLRAKGYAALLKSIAKEPRHRY